MADRDCKHGELARVCYRCELENALADRDRRIEALTKERDSWQEGYNRLADEGTRLLNERDKLREQLRDAKRQLRKALASAAGAEGEA